MKTAGQLLQSTRLLKKYELDEVSKITKIRPTFLRLIEADNYSQLPNGATARGFIHNYSEFLGLNPEHILAIFRRDFVENSLGQIVPRGMVESVTKSNVWTPKTTITAGVVLVFLIFGIYLFYQFKILTGPPSVKLFEPPPSVTTTESSIQVRGQTDPEATIAINGQLVALEKGGMFSLRITLNSGLNIVNILATAKSGKSVTLVRNVILTSSP